MLRNILIVLTLLSLTACSDNDAVASKTSTEKATHTESEGHNDTEHHDEKEEGHGEAEHKEEGGHGNEGGGHEEEGGSVHLKPEQMKMANIVVSELTLTDAAVMVSAPGEVKLNAYRTIKITPRIKAQITKRHAFLGDAVIEGQVLVTLSSVDVAEAQGQLLLADKEWRRVKKLSRSVVSAKRYAAAKIDYQKSYAKVSAFGMSKKEINALLAQKRSADGSFNLVAKQAGRVLHDKFIVGEVVEAGYELMIIADESTMWVEARVTPKIAGEIEVNNSAEIFIGKKRLPAKVIQLHHSLDETTRTSAVRLEVDNKNDELHAGMFVSTNITTSNTDKALQLPEAAVLRSSDGDWQIFVEQDEAGEFKPVEVEVQQFSNGQAIINGVNPGSRVVTEGAFFVQSELAKGGFEIHNH